MFLYETIFEKDSFRSSSDFNSCHSEIKTLLLKLFPDHQLFLASKEAYIPTTGAPHGVCSSRAGEKITLTISLLEWK